VLKFSYLRQRPLNLNENTGAVVAHEARYAEFLSETCDERPEANTLNYAVDFEAASDNTS
jgi:hypothetical protein